MSFESILRGGGAPRSSRLYRWLVSSLGTEEVNAISDTCQLRSAIISAGLYAVLVATLAGVIVSLAALLLWASVDLLISTGFGSFLTRLVLPFGAFLVFLRALSRAGSFKGGKRLLAFTLIGVLVIGGLALVWRVPAYNAGITTGEDLSLAHPQIFPPGIYGNLDQHPVIAVGLGITAILLSFLGLIAIGCGIVFAVWLIGWLTVLSYRAVTQTGFWEWVKGRLCHRFTWTD